MTTDPPAHEPTHEQAMRAWALHQAREVTATRTLGSSAVDAADVVAVANYILTGTHWYLDDRDGTGAGDD